MGEGSTSKVYLGRILRNAQFPIEVSTRMEPETKYVAIKILKDSYMKENYPRSVQSVQDEVKIMCKIDHKNVVKLYDFGEKGEVLKQSGRIIGGFTYLIMEYVHGDLLFDFVKNKGGIGEVGGKFVMSQMLEVLLYFSANGMCHRDLKLENIMITNNLEVKVADFGFAKSEKSDRLTSYRGTKTYMAPEIKEGKVYNGFQADIFSTGVILFSLVTGIFPFKEATNLDKYFLLLKEYKYEQYWNIIGRHCNMRLSPEFKDLIETMLKYEPNERIFVSNLQYHYWV